MAMHLLNIIGTWEQTCILGRKRGGGGVFSVLFTVSGVLGLLQGRMQPNRAFPQTLTLLLQ